jgi:hypothetical protein
MHSQSPAGLIELTTLPNEAEAGIIQSVLTDAGIESWTQKAPGFDFMGLGGFGFTLTTITVRAEDAERARAALDTNRQDSVDIDWSEVNVGEPEDESVARIAAGAEAERHHKARMSRRFPFGATLFWVAAIFAAIMLLGPALLVLVPIALIDLYRRSIE